MAVSYMDLMIGSLNECVEDAGVSIAVYVRLKTRSA